ncbi:MAG: outer membrane lipoprotein-sorting protein [Spirochaetales bacterium]|nr:outer membrane lipoprotein-sorting protein [Spirochaetales bacterium]
MKKNLVITLIVFLLAPLAAEPSLQEVMELAVFREDFRQASGPMEMILVDRTENEIRFGLTSYDLGDQDGFYRILAFTDPDRVNGTVLLIDDPHGEGGERILLLEPDTGEVEPLTSLADTFQGSDISYYDFFKPNVNDYNYSLYQEGRVEGQVVWVILAVPVDEGVIARTGYTKSLYFIRKDNYQIIRSKHWTRRPDEVKYFLVREEVMIDSLWYPSRLEVLVRRSGEVYHQTLLNRLVIDRETVLGKSLFTPEGMLLLRQDLLFEPELELDQEETP